MNQRKKFMETPSTPINKNTATFNDQDKFNLIENAVRSVLNEGFRTEDIYSDGTNLIGCEEMGDKVIERLEI